MNMLNAFLSNFPTCPFWLGQQDDHEAMNWHEQSIRMQGTYDKPAVYAMFEEHPPLSGCAWNEGSQLLGVKSGSRLII